MRGRPSSHGGAGGAAAAWAPLDRALRAHREGDRDAMVLMRTDVGGTEEVPAALFFRTPEAMGPVEAHALASARGSVLDLGAGPGAHAIPLARAGLAVTAVEVLPAACGALREGGVADVREGGLERVGAGERFDTILVMMNGLGLAGSLEGLAPFLSSLAAHLAPGGTIIADATDPRGWDDPDDGRYPGEVHMQLGYAGAWGDPFPFLFVDADRLRVTAEGVGLTVTVLVEEEGGRYLACITRAPPPRAP